MKGNLVLRGTALCQVCPGPSHHLPEADVPQRHFLGHPRQGSVCGRLSGPTAPSPGPQSSLLSPQPEVPGFHSPLAPLLHSSLATAAAPRPRARLLQRRLPMGPHDQPAQPKGHWADIPYPVVHMSDNSEITVKLGLLCCFPNLVLLV